MRNGKKNIHDLDFEQLKQQLESWSEPDYRVVQIWEGLYQQLWSTPECFTNIPLSLREKLAVSFAFGTLTPEKTLESDDRNTSKTLYRLDDDHAIETVIMHYKDRVTACVSSQVGCGMGCSFCATGTMGFKRNLSQGEIIEQVIKSDMILRNNGRKLSNVVFMGMGEPLHNLSNVMGAIHLLNDSRGYGMGARRFTISTVGLVPGIQLLIKENSQVNLAISLHAADDHLRDTLIPINQKYPISELMRVCDKYLSKTRRRITIEWALIDGINDSDEQARKLVDLIGGKLFHVNLIQLNPVKHYSGSPATDQRTKDFQQVLTQAGISTTIRLRRGIDISAGCGQLASKSP
jgi:23S rRNA (adenine2503-C2)-methyltransferase